MHIIGFRTFLRIPRRSETFSDVRPRPSTLMIERVAENGEHVATRRAEAPVSYNRLYVHFLRNGLQAGMAIVVALVVTQDENTRRVSWERVYISSAARLLLDHQHLFA